jgi:SAM-dependent methyltransferase
MEQTLVAGETRRALNAGSLRRIAMNTVFARATTDPTDDIGSVETLKLKDPACGAPYVPSPWWILHWLLPRSHVRPGDVFVDYGCGRGRIVVAAARRYKFARVVGVELSEDLSTTARALMQRERGRFRTPDVRIETTDVTAFEVPDDMTHAYMFNSFRGPVFEQVCANIVSSLDRAPRTLRLIYVQPEEHDLVMATGRFRLERKVRTTRFVSDVNVAVYTAK